VRAMRKIGVEYPEALIAEQLLVRFTHFIRSGRISSIYGGPREILEFEDALAEKVFGEKMRKSEA